MNIFERAIVSSFQRQVDTGIEEPIAQLKTVERSMRRLPQDDLVTTSLDALINILLQGLEVNIGGQFYVAQINELLSNPKGGLLKRLNGSVDKKTKNPKTSRGTIWRRNSTVKERRRQSPEWKDGPTAKAEAKRKNTVQLIPYDAWSEKQMRLQALQKKDRAESIKSKKKQRGNRVALELEYQRRFEEHLSPEEKTVTAFMECLQKLAEKNGIANEAEFYRRALISVKNDSPLSLIFVWGPPYEGQGSDPTIFLSDTPEKKMFDEIAKLIEDLRTTGIKLRPILLYADYYGTEINGMSSQSVTQYFDTLSTQFSEIAIAIPWSRVKAENSTTYQQLLCREDMKETIVLKEGIKNAMEIQIKLGKNITMAEAEKLAQRYSRERRIEGEMLANGFVQDGKTIDNLVKLATAPSRIRNDDPYENDLPRIYIKSMSRAAWNKPRKDK